ncbi:hypothetical protein Pmani_028866 [Petrolisthes manimaculis]|uniref:Uncharacterized protein n=1 Tax=Petrolisthes manimaculis TaxID=1843537 RepID=A0AAE1TUF9_9EUCA|nr:hypothetical protein Pmani_028866 [Petrolisthes manimaculis]
MDTGTAVGCFQATLKLGNRHCIAIMPVENPLCPTVEGRLGERLCIPDALSRAPVSRPTSEDETCQLLQPSQQQELIMCDDHPTRPFESVSPDFFHVQL